MEFPRVIGAINGTHGPISNPKGMDALRYMNRERFYSINVQMCCDAKYIVRSVVARWPETLDQAYLQQSIK